MAGLHTYALVDRLAERPLRLVHVSAIGRKLTLPADIGDKVRRQVID